eukprot:m.141220 g.141220  ORF g.141220 m.141220 type:complete len:439 (+) comp30169_c0_seq1:88-1404(+)
MIMTNSNLLSAAAFATLLTLGSGAAVVTSPKCDECASERAEYCEIFPNSKACDDVCGFEFDVATQKCWIVGTQPVIARSNGDAAPIIGGSGKFRYQYMPELVVPPTGAQMANCHGLSVDKDENIILTYQGMGTDPHCIITWKPDGTGGEFAAKDSPQLCTGTPHGLKITTENNTQYLYHANNAQKLAKTTLDGEIIWIKDGNFGQNDTCTNATCPNNSCRCTDGKAPYIPTWFATPPDSKYMYLCDGYGSDHVYAFESATGTYMNKFWGGRSPAGLKPGAAASQQPHGLFMENHGCTYDPRPTTEPHSIVVSDRRNMRFEFFHYDPMGFEMFEYYKTVDMSGPLGPETLPCNMRMTHGSKFDPSKQGRSIVPDLNGPVAVLDSDHNVLSVVNVSVLLAAEQHKHPHDAIFLANGDMVVATWAPGRISYWKLLPTLEEN